MTSSKALWDEMKTPDSDYTVRYATATGDVTLCWGKDVQGQCLFIVQLEGDHTEQFRKNATTVNGIEVDLRLRETGIRQRAQNEKRSSQSQNRTGHSGIF
jgi:hypothetical protein